MDTSEHFRRRIGLCRGATRAAPKREDARRQRGALAAARAPLFLVLVLAYLAILASCAGTANWDITPPPEGAWPFDRWGNYDERYANGRHPDADLYWEAIHNGIDIMEADLRATELE